MRRPARTMAATPARRRWRWRGGRGAAALAFLAPALLLLLVVRLVPMVSAVVSSFRRPALSSSGGGLHNYSLVLGDEQFHRTLLATAEFLVVIVPAQILLALLLALLLVQRLPAMGVVRMLVFLPVAAPAAVASVVWGVAYQPQGPINAVLKSAGIGAQPFLTSPSQALWCLVVLMSWIGVGYWTLFLVAGLQDIPRELYEAAAIDGAGWWRCLTGVTLPNLRRTLVFVVVADTVSSAVAFVPVQVLTRGGPAGSTRLIMYDVYNTTYVNGNANVGQAEVVLLLVVLVAVTAVQFRLLNRGG